MRSFTSQDQRLARAGIAAAVALCSCLIANGASAGQPQRVSVTVSFADLDLSKPAGAQTLYKRIRAAARRVCGPVDAHIAVRRSSGECLGTAIADAVAQVDRPSLTALHEADASRSVRI